MDTEGKFNGSCTSADANPISPEVPSGSCASYFPDVTRYCCAAVGGSYNDTNTAVEDMSLNASALNHPTCVTTSYRDMLSCYRFVTETYCSSQNVSPYGVCSQAGQDTSNSAGEAARRPTAKTWIATVGLFGVAVCLGTLWS
ncbi:hypothetical protein IE53DRAFT_321974 [Violaceomyces palustris]|uniref:Uncharacterized protein n=1 Tax=Violaceomyces palustris TaxID=1673888 RepID=A0ACD0NMG1_9BASI|nr:hypothetical protein IE53DRAFT_321974 [Violaceomyces palustris]